MQTFLSNPIFWITIVISVAIFSKKKKWKIIGMLIFLIFTNHWLAYFTFHLWEYQTIQADDIKFPYEIGVLLGPFIFSHGEDFSINFPNCEGNSRFNESIALYQQGKFKKILLSGDDNIEQAKALLIHKGILPENLLIEGASQNTYENALYTKKLLIEKGDTSERILLLTSANHMRRAIKCFDKVGLKVTPYSVDHLSNCSNVWDIGLKDIIPIEYGLVYWRILMRECFSMLVFFIYGYI